MRRRLRDMLLISLLVIATGLLPAQPAAASHNDFFSQAITLSAGSAHSHSNVGATTETNEPFSQFCPNIRATTWYRFVPTQTGILSVTTLSDVTNFDTEVVVWRGTSLTGLTYVGCNTDTGLSQQSWREVDVTANQTYYIQVGGKFGATGNYVLSISLLNTAEGRSCADSQHYFSIACLYASAFSPYSGAFAKWQSFPNVNVSSSACTGGGWVQEALWFQNHIDNPDLFSYVEIGDRAGVLSVVGQGPQSCFERWWVFVDGWTDGSTYGENAIPYAPTGGPAPQDSILRSYGFQWDPQLGNTWGLYIGNGQTFDRVASRSWMDPALMSQQQMAVGMEVSSQMMNANANTPIFQDTGLALRDPSGGWFSWPTISSQVDSRCNLPSRPSA